MPYAHTSLCRRCPPGCSYALSAQEPQRISLWANGAPGSEARRAEPEQAKDYWVKNIHDPSITVYLPPKDKATGAGVVVIPGGGHRMLVYTAEGVEPAQYLNGLGVAAFVLKHRLQREEGSTYTIERDARADAYRALRTVRSRAAEFGVDPKRLGVMGFSAGGEVVGLVAFGSGDGDAQAPDPIDRANGRPDFAIFIYPGPLAVQASVPSTAPPAFLATASDDPCCSVPTLKILQQVQGRRRARRSARLRQGRARLQHGPALEAEGREYLAAAPRGLAQRQRSAERPVTRSL